ncbi:4-(cytidine 5'-diphospho)-2-C-methyl-D-erythritol kinase [Thermosipho ferrireducens]|uniref:4-diphosphocytidyl-2-C-methyl-D-erythritol kinase n=1 Tax=Thermosipho ferrireducens TaxID=2571116 RepID=A0ABX7S6H5_9BACT|nr:4-(cytidine 5'-diphospho)-2-C-methyl-D-erythritol kinase [Thermosipho ferrireducens]QTA38182.1 4-(cytidine 5'-diphospho)-2-C-methyl-D-erythritol kinase [Thermosipho ferrireducens]
MEQSGSKTLRAYAKINLYLDVIGRRKDGYHDIISLFQNISLYDTLYIEKKDKGIEIETNEHIENNILYRTWNIFANQLGTPDFGVKIILEKRIPIKAGLGGGSADAAALLRFLGDTMKIPEHQLLKVAAIVGSDVPFFLYGGTAIVKGKGHIIEKLKPLSGYKVRLLVAKEGISTRDAYATLKEKHFKKSTCEVYELYEAYFYRNLSQISKCTYNIFEHVLLPVYEEIDGNLKKLKRNCIAAALTGSGSAVFGISLTQGDYEFVKRGVEYETSEI